MRGNALDGAREAFDRQAWAEAYAALSALDGEAVLEPADLEMLAMAAELIGEEDRSEESWTRAHHAHVRAGDQARAARCAFWLGMSLIQDRGEMARGGGWLARAKRILDEAQVDCVEQGYVMVPMALQTMEGGDPAAAYAMFAEAARIGGRFGDRDLVTLTQLGRGQASILLGENARGVAFLDEAMVATTAGEISPIVVGIAYCAVIDACQLIFDIGRAQEWTAALTRWCEAHPEMVPFRGQCLVHRAEILQLHGAWPDALGEALRACERLSGQPAVGAAFYLRAELHRLRGEFGPAEEDYREAHGWGAGPQPGLALLRLWQGQVDAADGSIRRALAEARDRIGRSKLLPAFVEIALAADDVAAARDGADELDAIAEDLDMPFVRAVSANARGAILLAEGDADAALASLREAWAVWRTLEAPYEAARVRVLVGLACRQLGDEDTAEMELDAAARVFGQLGAAPDLARVEGLARSPRPEPSGGLTGREVQVLALVATGRTNRAIAAELVISEKTVARHVSNIFTKLGLSSRSAATAYAYEHGLV